MFATTALTTSDDKLVIISDVFFYFWFSAQKIFSGEIKNHLLMFLSKKAEAYKGQYEIASSIAKVIYTFFILGIIFINADVSNFM